MTIKTAGLVATGQAVKGGLVSAQVSVLAEGVIKAMFMTKIKMVAALVVAGSVRVTGAGMVGHRVLATPSLDSPGQTVSQGKPKITARDIPPGSPGGVSQDQKPSPPPASDVEKLLSDDIEVYLVARKKLLAQGLTSKALVEKQRQRLPAGVEERLRLRLLALLTELDAQEANTERLRIIDSGLRRAAEMRQNQAGKKIVVLVASWATIRNGDTLRDDPYQNLCYFSFPKETHSYEGTESLEFGDRKTDSRFYVSMVVGPQNRIKAKVGHVYLENCLIPRHQVDMTVKFKILDLKPGEWVIIEWEPIPQDK